MRTRHELENGRESFDLPSLLLELEELEEEEEDEEEHGEKRELPTSCDDLAE